MPPGPRRRPRTLLEPPQRANAADEKIRPDARLQKAPTGGSPHHPPAAKAGATPRGVSRFPLPALSAESHASNRRLAEARSEEHTSELQSLMRISYAVFCLKKKNKTNIHEQDTTNIHNKLPVEQ